MTSQTYPISVPSVNEVVKIKLLNPCEDPSVLKFSDQVNATESIFQLGMDKESIKILWPEELDFGNIDIMKYFCGTH